MLLVYFLVWILLNGRFDGDVLISGAVASLLTYAFTVFVVGLTPKKELRGWKKLLAGIRYAGYLVGEIWKANIQTLGLVFDPKKELEPQLVTIKTSVSGDIARVALANSITLTPGTITVSQDGDTLLVHALDRETAEGLTDNGFEKRLVAMEEER